MGNIYARRFGLSRVEIFVQRLAPLAVGGKSARCINKHPESTSFRYPNADTLAVGKPDYILGVRPNRGDSRAISPIGVHANYIARYLQEVTVCHKSSVVCIERVSGDWVA